MCCQIFPALVNLASRLFRRRAQTAGFANFPMLYFILFSRVPFLPSGSRHLVG